MVRTRFAPSPTGYLHIGGARTALFNWLYARRLGGKFILRIEDTDVQRSTEESVGAILDSMKWLGLDWDEGPFYQSRRMDRYNHFAQKLLAEGKAYRCYCTPEELQERREAAMKEGRKPGYDRRCRDLKEPVAGRTGVVRFKAPLDGETRFDDMIKGPITFRNEELDDLIIIRSDGFPTYNFAVVIDDAEMEITHIIRGDDHVNNTPRQIQIYEALGFPLPIFAHVPMILGSDKTRLSKRHGATSVMEYQKAGFLPEALVNYLVRLGWSHGDQEIFSAAEMIAKFNAESIGKSPAVFNPEKLLWLNGHYIKESSPLVIGGLAWEFFGAKGYTRPDDATLERIIRSLQQRSKTLVELADMGDCYFNGDFEFDAAGAAKFFSEDAALILEEIATCLKADPAMTEAGFEQLIKGLAERKAVKVVQVAQPLRLALTGRTISPGLFDIIAVTGVDESLRRIGQAIAYIRKKS